MDSERRTPFGKLPLSTRAGIILSGAAYVAAILFTCARYYGWLGFEGTRQHRAEWIAARKVIKD